MRFIVSSFFVMALIGSASWAQSTVQAESQLSRDVSSGGYIPASILEDGLRTCETLGNNQLEQCGAVLLNAVRTALRFRTQSLQTSNERVTGTDIFISRDVEPFSFSDEHDLRSQVVQMELELQVLIEENSRLWAEISRARSR